MKHLYLNSIGSVISKNNIYSSRKFWVDLINLKIVKRFENKKKMVQDTKNANLIIPTQIDLDNFNLINNNSLFSNIGTKFFNYFNTGVNKDLTNISETNEANEKLQKKIDKAKIHEVTHIIKEFIPHFSNFNFEISEAIDIIVELATM